MSMQDWMYRRYDDGMREQKRRDPSIIRMIEGYDPSMNETEEKETKMTIDWTQPIETVQGHPLRYIGETKTTGKVVVENLDSGTIYLVYHDDGKYDLNRNTWNVRNVPEKPKIETRWINLYESIKSGCYFSKETADQGAARDRTGMIEITYKDGKPIDVKLHSVDE